MDVNTGTNHHGTHTSFVDGRGFHRGHQCGAVALTPVAPAVGVPPISTLTAEVALTQFANPIGASLNTAYVLGNYILNGADTSPDFNWPGSGIGAVINGLPPIAGVAIPPPSSEAGAVRFLRASVG